MSDLKDRLLSRKFLLALAAVIYTVIQVAGGALTPQQGEQAIQVIVGAYLATEGVADAITRAKTPAELPAATASVPPVPPV